MPTKPSAEPRTFAQVFSAMLKARGLSQRQAAILLKVSDSQVSRWKHGIGGISLDSVERIATVFGVARDPLAHLANLRDNAPSFTEADIAPELAALIDAETNDLLGEMRGIPESFWPTVIATQRAARRMAVDVARSAIELMQGSGAVSLAPDTELAPPGHRRRRDDKAPDPARKGTLPTALQPAYAN